VLFCGMQRFVLAAFAILILVHSRADTLNLINGDRFIGLVQLVNESEVQIKSEVVGLLKVPRDKVASIYFGTNRPPIDLGFGAQSEQSIPLKEKIDPKAVDQVQKEFLGTATPEANAMFTELVQGLSSGKLSISDIRKQAADSLKELRELQAEVGEDADNPLLSGYVGILEKFIRAGETNKPAAKPTEKPAPKRALPVDDE
jgi:hypothetical protein